MQVRVLPGSIFSTLGHKALASRSAHVKQTKHLQRSRQKKSTQQATMCKPAYRTNFFIPFYILTFMCIALSRNSGTCGLVAMTSASHAEGRQFDPGQVYLNLSNWPSPDCKNQAIHEARPGENTSACIEKTAQKKLTRYVHGDPSATVMISASASTVCRYIPITCIAPHHTLQEPGSGKSTNSNFNLYRQ